MSDGELLAILLRTGGSGKGAQELAQELLCAAGGRLASLFNMSPFELLGIPNIGPGKASSLLAAAELGKRFLQESACSESMPISSARTVYDLMIPRMKGLADEECWAIWTDRSNVITGRSRVTTGGASSTTFDTRKICRLLLERKASGLVLVHNHPSGNPKPSNADITSTKALHLALNSIGAVLLDHVIVSDGAFYSFASERVFKA